MVEKNLSMDDSTLSEDGVSKSCASSSALKISLKNSKTKIDEFFRGKTYDFRKKAKRTRKYEENNKPNEEINNNLPADEKVKDDKKDVNVFSSTSLTELNKKRKILTVSGFLSPILSMKKLSNAFQKNLADKKASAILQTNILPGEVKECASSNSSLYARQSSFWYESLAKCDIGKMDKRELDRQEAIFELFKSEIDLIEDLKMLCNTYRNSMMKLGLLSENEMSMIFGEIDSLIPIHRDLADKMIKQRLADGRTDLIGNILLDWIPNLIIYVLYCRNQIFSKDLLDLKVKEDESFRDFLDRCLNSPFSRKLDLWTFLDLPRSRLVKYPIMFKNIHKYTDQIHDDYKLLLESIHLVEEVIKEVDFNVGLARCKYIVDKLEYACAKQKSPLVEESSLIICEGVLKNMRGMKIHIFLFDKVLVMTRPVIYKDGSTKFRVYRKPVATSKLFLIQSHYSIKSKQIDNNPVHKEISKDGVLPKRNRNFSECLENPEYSCLDTNSDLILQPSHVDHNFEERSKASSESFSSRASSSFRSVFSSNSSNPSKTNLSMNSNTNSTSQQSCNLKSSVIELISYSDQEDDRSENGLVFFGGRKTRYTFKADNDLDKQHWIQCLKQCVRGCIDRDRRSSLESTVLNTMGSNSKDSDSDKYSCSCSDSYFEKSKSEKQVKFAMANKARTSIGGLSVYSEKDIGKFDDQKSGWFGSSVSSHSSMVSVFSDDSGFHNNNNRENCPACKCFNKYRISYPNIGDVNYNPLMFDECILCLSKTPIKEVDRPKYLAATNLEDL